MKPPTTYVALQCELKALIDQERKEGRDKLRSQLERKFMKAWRLTADQRRATAKLHEALRRQNTHGMDHCSYFTGANEQPVIVTQPYGDWVDALEGSLRLETGMAAEVIDATEWGFHFPGEAKLIILKFPRGYSEALKQQRQKVERSSTRLCQV